MPETKTIILGGGCFWCTEAVFRLFPGIVSAAPGYAGGHTKNPTYREVCDGDTGHAEVLKIDYDPKVISMEKILEIFFSMHDPTSINRQGPDEGEQYRSIILYLDDGDRNRIESYVDGIRGEYEKPIVTEIRKLDAFYEAEDYHKDYYRNNRLNPYCALVISPKIRKIKQEFGLTQTRKSRS